MGWFICCVPSLFPFVGIWISYYLHVLPIHSLPFLVSWSYISFHSTLHIVLSLFLCLVFFYLHHLLHMRTPPYYSCGFSTATIEYSSLSVCLSVCVHDNSKNNGSIHLKLEHIVVYGNSSDKFDIGHCPIKVKVTA